MVVATFGKVHFQTLQFQTFRVKMNAFIIVMIAGMQVIDEINFNRYKETAV